MQISVFNLTENYVRKEENTDYHEFSLFPIMFSKSFFLRDVKTWGSVVKCQLFTIQSQLLTTQKKKALENTVRKGENAGNQHFLLFPQCFTPFPRQILIFQPNLICHLVTSILSFSHNVFYPSQNKFQFFNLSSSLCFQFGTV